MPNRSRRQFADALAALLDTTRHLVSEVDRLNAHLRETLQTPPLAFRSVGASKMGKASTSDPDQRLVRDWYARLFALRDRGTATRDEEAELDEPEGSDDDDAADGQRPSRRQRLIRIPVGQPLLVVKVVLRDPVGRANFEPEVQYAILGDWASGHAATRFGPGHTFTLGPVMLRRMLKAVPLRTPGLANQRIMTPARVQRPKGAKNRKKKGDRNLSFRILGAMAGRPLYELDSPETVDRLIAEIRAHWRRVVQVRQRRPLRGLGTRRARRLQDGRRR
jgi:hypothetical protein